MGHQFKVVENKPYGTYAVLELWAGGVVRSPFATREEAIEQEQSIRDYYSDLELIEP